MTTQFIKMKIDLNSDLGESFALLETGLDEAMMQTITSANIACGFHAGDPIVMERTVRLARKCNVAIGAHPSYPDLAGFGRREMHLSPEEIEACVLYQVSALAGFARSQSLELIHVKPHGALYTASVNNADVAHAVAQGVARFSRELILVGLAGSLLLSAGGEIGLKVASEAFVDRVYNPDGTLRSRQLPDALITDPEKAAEQALRIIREGQLISYQGVTIKLHADTICIHGDTPNAPMIAAELKKRLIEAGVKIVPLAEIVGRT